MAKILNPSSNPSALIQTSVQVPENGVDAMDAGQIELIAQRMLDNDKVAKDHIDSTSPHQATSGANANRLMVRDGAGRAQVASPTAAADIATKSYVDGVGNASLKKNDIGLGAYTTQLIGASGGTWLVPEGVYLLVPITGSVRLQITSNTSIWVTPNQDFGGGVVLSDGANVRFINQNPTVNADIAYRKVA